MPQTPGRLYSGLDMQQRVDRRRAQLMDAALSLLTGEYPDEPITVRAVCKRASLGPRYFYESFTDVDSLGAAVFQETFDLVAQRAAAGFTRGGPGLAARIEGGLRAIVDLIIEDPRKGRLFFSPVLVSPVLATRREASADAFAALILKQWSPGSAQPGPSRAVAARFIVGGLAQVLAGVVDGKDELDSDLIVAQCARIVFALSRDDDRDVVHESARSGKR
ncbi:TetR/AcrR family transcriptional regulator [Hoyosella sp. YIM 151337]|uniref:TetR/AcrR family transcriptional regulator n=1 Tax=Hoyosella sp. YIM 151337 TaxID=2992742 RepID=UPI002236B3E9|nr:TetR/AcrR family transcriptional regulator [Hoyosella sp. YIM 151337]MCW4353396.1 TetR/AcrR family transcriptional regulator [Hoyosella sp. YIM 151337]